MAKHAVAGSASSLVGSCSAVVIEEALAESLAAISLPLEMKDRAVVEPRDPVRVEPGRRRVQTGGQRVVDDGHRAGRQHAERNEKAGHHLR